MNLSSVLDPDPGFNADPDLDFQNLESDPSVYKIMMFLNRLWRSLTKGQC